MSKNKLIFFVILVILIAALIITWLILYSKKYNWGALDKGDNLIKYDTSLPDLSPAYLSQSDAEQNGGGWYQTLYEDFDGDSLPSPWRYSPHGKRNTEFWCDDMVSFDDGCCIIKAEIDNNHSCSFCKDALLKEPDSYRNSFKNEYTGGIETRYFDEDGNNIQTFSQAFGYYEVRVKLPKAGGMWAAFWLQSVCQGKIGNDGEDGTEIDVFESAFLNYDKRKMGHALLYDGYAKYGKVMGYINSNDSDLYDGFHTFGLKWTPDEYVYYVDGVARWATDFGGVSKVPEFLRLTCEIRHGYGPHGMKLSEFNSDTENPALFYVDYVKVYQNTEYLSSIKSDNDFISKK